MNLAKKRILIIDDSPEDIQIVMKSIEQDYAILVATNGQKGIELSGAVNKPDVILMDVEMPGMDGYQTCKKIKQNPATQDIDVIFVSAHNTVEEKLKGYDAGGCDYLIKPVAPSELLRKLELSIQNKQLKDSSSEQKNKAMHTAMAVISAIEELRIVLNFIQNSVSIMETELLAQELLKSFKLLSLTVTLALWDDKGKKFYKASGPTQPIEEEILSLAGEKYKNKISVFGRQCLVAGTRSTLLVHNFPEDQETAERYKEILLMLIQNVDLLCNQIGLKSSLSQSEMQLTQAMLMTSQAIKSLKQKTANSRLKIKQASDGLVSKIEHKFMTLGLTEEQERDLISMILEAEGLIDREISTSIELEDEMERILDINTDLRWKNSSH